MPDNDATAAAGAAGNADDDRDNEALNIAAAMLAGDSSCDRCSGSFWWPNGCGENGS
jgi:hypothetical protein